MVIISQLPKIIHRFCPRDANFEPIALYVSTISKKVNFYIVMVSYVEHTQRHKTKGL